MTGRKEMEYLDNRHPDSVVYINDLKTDLLRRDFTINSICMNKDGEIVDLLNGKKDLERKVVNTINDSIKSFEDDSLRILRAIRFATTLNFTLSDEIINAINKTKHLLKNLSYTRKKYELDHIFASSRAKEGINLLKELDLLEILEINNIDRVKDYSDIIGIWAMINTNSYNFSNSEKELIKKINIVYELDNLDRHVLYKYGLYVNVLAALNKGLDKKNMIEIYQSLQIHSRRDIVLEAETICKVLNKKPSSFINDIYLDLEEKLIDEELENNEECLIDYVKKHYQ